MNQPLMKVWGSSQLLFISDFQPLVGQNAMLENSELSSSFMQCVNVTLIIEGVRLGDRMKCLRKLLALTANTPPVAVVSVSPSYERQRINIFYYTPRRRDI